MRYLEVYAFLLSFVYGNKCQADAMCQPYPPIVINVFTDASGNLSSSLCANQYVDTKNSLIFSPEWITSGKSLLHKYTRLIAGCSIATIYGLLYRKVLQLNRCLASQVWSVWKEHLPLDRLMSIPREDFIKELLVGIQHDYSNTSHPTNSLSLFADFLHALEKEEKIINEYLFVYKWSTRFLFDRTLPFITAEINYTSQRLKRLVFIKNTFQNWAVDQKIPCLKIAAGKNNEYH